MQSGKIVTLFFVIMAAVVVMSCSDGKQDTKKEAISTSIETVQKVPAPQSGVDINFSKTQHPADLLDVSGLSRVESWGRWSDGDKVIFKFASTLPAKFSLKITAKAYGPNAGEPVTVKAGNQTKEYKFVADASQTQSAEFSLPEPADTIEILIPKPTSPGKADKRLLGLALSHLSLIPLP